MDFPIYALEGNGSNPNDPHRQQRDTTYQLAISAVLGIGAFLTFCILRTRWPGLYAARKKTSDAVAALPDLPDSFFGWIPTLWKVTDNQVLASAGLDAYVFLAFFKMATKFLVITLFFSLVIIKPVHDRFPEPVVKRKKNDSTGSTSIVDGTSGGLFNVQQALAGNDVQASEAMLEYYHTDYLWMYLAFAYFFTGLIMYLLWKETNKIIEVRQEYLGCQTTVTDRTIRLSGIPPELRSEEKIKAFVEELEIGKVESVLLCKNWKELDDLMVERSTILRRLEEAWTVHQGVRRVERNLESLPISQPPPPGPDVNEESEEESSHLLRQNGNAGDHISPYHRDRPKAKVWYGRFKLRYHYVDAIDYYEGKLRRLDEKIRDARKKEFEATPLAFVTMDSVASCQMAIQAVLDPSPRQLLANPSPAPVDVVWPNTYLPRSKRMIRAWSITVIIIFLTVFWSAIQVPIAVAINIESIKKLWPQLGDTLESHPFVKSLIETQLPTLILSLLNVLVPYFYDWLSNLQGMTSQGDVELSVISKNFFFTFFNFFVVFTLLGTASKSIPKIKDISDDIGKNFEGGTSMIANTLARSLQDLLQFYVNFIILQAIGLFPFRLLEIGSVLTYPINRIGAKTPRDYAELVQPPIFSYGFFLPQTILVFIICIVYSVLRQSWKVLLSGLAYFVIGQFVHKYQLLYAMYHRQHATGRAWLMICNRIFAGVVVFQLTMLGQLALKGAVRRSTLILPLIALTLWFSYYFARTYQPLMRFIALRSLRRAEHSEQSELYRAIQDAHGSDTPSPRSRSETRNHQHIDDSSETGIRFINPSLIAPLEDVWIVDKNGRHEDDGSHAVSAGLGSV